MNDELIFVYLKTSRLLTFTNLLTNVNTKVDLLTWYCRSSPGAEVDLTLYQVNPKVDGKSIKKVDGTTLVISVCSVSKPTVPT